MEIETRLEGTMNGTATPHYGFQPQVPFAATRAWAERHAQETATAAATAGRWRSARLRIRRLARRRS